MLTALLALLGEQLAVGIATARLRGQAQQAEIERERAREAGGSLRIESARGQGTRIVLALPRAQGR
jgi:nitrate/nitrite-specific signal transduction histidine kinase